LDKRGGAIIESGMARFVNLAAAAGAVFLLGIAALPSAQSAPADGIVLAPHRAFYELKLARSNGNRGISGVHGRILYDFSGNACEGYDLKFRQVSELDSMESNDALSDLTSNTWEDGQAKKFRFSSENKLNQQTGDVVDGRAERKSDAVAVALQKPAEKTFRIPVDAVFPTEHMRKIIAAGRAGKKVLDLVVYDGSESGEKLYNTLTVVGRPIEPGANPPPDVAAKSPELAKLTRWPVTVSYFDRKEKSERDGEQTPVYSISFELYENGISRALMLNYSDFSISGELTSLEMKKAKPCP
jgi:hypothetical protein